MPGPTLEHATTVEVFLLVFFSCVLVLSPAVLIRVSRQHPIPAQISGVIAAVYCVPLLLIDLAVSRGIASGRTFFCVAAWAISVVIMSMRHRATSWTHRASIQGIAGQPVVPDDALAPSQLVTPPSATALFMNKTKIAVIVTVAALVVACLASDRVARLLSDFSTGIAGFAFGIAIPLSLAILCYALTTRPDLEVVADWKKCGVAFAMLVLIALTSRSMFVRLDGNGDVVIVDVKDWGTKREEYRMRWQRNDDRDKDDPPFIWVHNPHGKRPDKIFPGDYMPWERLEERPDTEW